MSGEYTYYPPKFKERVVGYRTSTNPTPSFRAVAEHFNIRGGKGLVKRWCDAAAQGEKEETRGRKRKLTKEQVEEHILKHTQEQNKENNHVDFDTIHDHIQDILEVDLSISTVKKYAHDEAKITSKQHTLVAPNDGQVSYNTKYTHKLCLFFTRSLSVCPSLR